MFRESDDPRGQRHGECCGGAANVHAEKQGEESEVGPEGRAEWQSGAGTSQSSNRNRAAFRSGNRKLVTGVVGVVTFGDLCLSFTVRSQVGMCGRIGRRAVRL